MDDRALGELTAGLRDRVAVVRGRRRDVGSLMPDDAELVRELAALAADCPPDTEPLAFWTVVGLLLYGNPGVPLSSARVAHAAAYATRWQRRGGAIVFRDGGLLQLLFLYGLGVRRPAGSVGDESPEQAAAWGAAPWPGALLALRRFLIGLAVWLVTGLRRLGFRDVDLLGEFAGSRSGRPADAFGRCLADHTVGVLLGHTKCLCAELFRDANPGSPAGCAERRHEHRHLLTGYLDGHWPAGRNYASQPFPLTEHVFRAACGGQPTRPRALEEGIWFSLIRATSASLVVLKVLVCETCRNHLAGFEECTTCGTAWPQNRIVDWLATEDDERFRAAEGKECRRCGRLAPLGNEACACGSAGVGFTRVIKGTGQVQCVACAKRLPRTMHACPHAPCLNADYGGVTNFHVRLDEASVDTVPFCTSPHRGSGVFRRPIPRKTDVADGLADHSPESPENPPAGRSAGAALPVALQTPQRPTVELPAEAPATVFAFARTPTSLGRDA